MIKNCHVQSDLGWVGSVLARLRHFWGCRRSMWFLVASLGPPMGEIMGGVLGSQWGCGSGRTIDDDLSYVYQPEAKCQSRENRQKLRPLGW